MAPVRGEARSEDPPVRLTLVSNAHRGGVGGLLKPLSLLSLLLYIYIFFRKEYTPQHRIGKSNQRQTCWVLHEATNDQHKMVNCASAKETHSSNVGFFMFYLVFLNLIQFSCIRIPLTLLTVTTTKLVITGEFRFKALAHRVLLVFEPGKTVLSVKAPNNASA